MPALYVAKKHYTTYKRIISRVLLFICRYSHLCVKAKKDTSHQLYREDNKTILTPHLRNDMRSATITIPYDLEHELEDFLAISRCPAITDQCDANGFPQLSGAKEMA